MPFLEVGGDKLHYLDEGEGVPVVFVHGACGGASQWKKLASALSDRYRTVCIDLFGNGESEPWPKERRWSPDDDQRPIDTVISRLKGPFHVIAHSGGSNSVYPSLRMHRDRIRSVTLFEPTFFQFLRHAHDDLFSEPEHMATRFRELVDIGDLEAAMASFVDVWANEQGAWNSLPDGVKEKMKIGAGRTYHTWLLPWEDDPKMEDLRDLKLPMLLIKGSETIPSMHRICELIRQGTPGCRYAEIDGAGHMCPFTHWRRVLPLVEEHISNN